MRYFSLHVSLNTALVLQAIVCDTNYELIELMGCTPLFRCGSRLFSQEGEGVGGGGGGGPEKKGHTLLHRNLKGQISIHMLQTSPSFES